MQRLFEVWGDSHTSEPAQFFGLGAAAELRRVALDDPAVGLVENHSFPGAKVRDWMGYFVEEQRSPYAVISSGTNEGFAAHAGADGDELTNFWRCLKWHADRMNVTLLWIPAQTGQGIPTAVPAMGLYAALPSALGIQTVPWVPHLSEMHTDGIHYNTKGSKRLARETITKLKTV